MARPLRLEFSGALYHVTSRGDRREDSYLDDDDRTDWLMVLDKVCGRFNWVVHAYCQMTNHYHLLVETVDGNLSKGMRQLNGQYTQRFNRRHKMVGHLFQGRYKAILVQKDAYLLELTRYVVLNPIRADMVDDLKDWQWSSYPAVVGLGASPEWLDTDWLLSQFAKYRKTAIKRYHQFILGDDLFVGQYNQQKKPEELREVSRAHRKALAPSLLEFQRRYDERNEAMAREKLPGSGRTPSSAINQAG